MTTENRPDVGVVQSNEKQPETRENTGSDGVVQSCPEGGHQTIPQSPESRMDAGDRCGLPACPEGYQLVPVAPTPEMIKEAMEFLMRGCDIYAVNDGETIVVETATPGDLWRLMLRAAPLLDGLSAVESWRRMNDRLQAISDQESAKKADACVELMSDKPTCGAQNGECERQAQQAVTFVHELAMGAYRPEEIEAMAIAISRIAPLEAAA